MLSLKITHSLLRKRRGGGGERSEVEKVWQPGNLIARKFLKNPALAESFWIFLLHYLTNKRFGKCIKEIILVFLENVHIFCPFFYNTRISGALRAP